MVTKREVLQDGIAARQLRSVNLFCLALVGLFSLSIVLRLYGLFGHEYDGAVAEFNRHAQRIDAELRAIKRVNVRQALWIGARVDTPELDTPIETVLGAPVSTSTHFEYRLLDETAQPLGAVYIASMPDRLSPEERRLLPALQELLLLQTVSLRTNPLLQRTVFVSRSGHLLVRAPAIRPEQEPFWPNWIDDVLKYQLKQYGDVQRLPRDGWWILPDESRPSRRGRVRFSSPVIHRGKVLGLVSANVATAALASHLQAGLACVPRTRPCALVDAGVTLASIGPWPADHQPDALSKSSLKPGNAWVDWDLRMVRHLSEAPWQMVGEVSFTQLVEPVLPAALKSVGLVLLLLGILGYARYRFMRYVLLPEMEMRRDLAKARDAAEAGARAKAAFLAVMSHEIRTPMTGVLGTLDVLERLSPTEAQSRALCTIRNSGQTLLRIIDDILDFSKIEAGRMTLEPEPCDLAELLGDVIELYVGSAQAGGILLKFYAAPEVRAYEADPIRIRQIVGNLLSNAIKFTAPGGAVMVETDLDENDFVRIRVTDTGIGIAQNSLPLLFQPFAQAEGMISRSFGGTGLGLSIIRHLVDLMSGEVLVASTVGVGSIFTVKLPLLRAKSAVRGEGVDLCGVRVCLAVEDALGEKWYGRYLVSHGATIKFHSGVVGDVRSQDSDVIVCDASLLPTSEELMQRISARTVVISSRKDAAPREGRGELASICRRGAFVEAVAMAAGRLSLPDELPSESAGQRQTVLEASGEHQLVLLVEDSIVNQEVISQQLTLLGYEVRTAINGKAALEALAHGRYSLVLTDCNMPEMDGYELAKAIRRSESVKDARMPVIALTANAHRGEAERCFAAGIDDYLVKPADMGNLQRVISKWLER
ncbi:ATP-binding protein [Lysobacter sp. GCM10012299]|uniref:ATP-binding protein n=1 Tax=Lysobacter sp. GCM10012299 TaxID=3317333 RepID=UPI0036142AFF